MLGSKACRPFLKLTAHAFWEVVLRLVYREYITAETHVDNYSSTRLDLYAHQCLLGLLLRASVLTS